ncbi:formyltransferase family protein [Propionivibrio sp.]|uniref:formyltransferase family protein n=1 Tax=Propionivibrio sp. TaxID=2212460 RepID=UPI003BF0160C
MRVACVGYRSWALNIYDSLAQNSEHSFLIFRSKAQFKEEVLRDFRPDFVLFYGWSWYVSEQLLNDFKCLMLHPSPLPKYRGGSPIQNQIIAGEIDSKVTIFLMNSEIDAGDIAAQESFSLSGSITDIFSRIEKLGIELTSRILDSNFNPSPQDHTNATYCKRRKPEDSEITLNELIEKDSVYLYNKIRMLADPYPNAFFRTADGKRLTFTVADIQEE